MGVVSSYMPSSAAQFTRSVERLKFEFTARPQAMSVYARFIERGTIDYIHIAVQDSIVWQIGAAGTASARLYVIATASAGRNYQLVHQTVTGTVTVTLADSPTVNDEVELFVELNADGSILLRQSLNGSAVTSTAVSGAVSLAQTWSAEQLILNSNGTDFIGFNAFRNVVAHRGVQSLATMRRVAGVI